LYDLFIFLYLCLPPFLLERVKIRDSLVCLERWHIRTPKPWLKKEVTISRWGKQSPLIIEKKRNIQYECGLLGSFLFFLFFFFFSLKWRSVVVLLGWAAELHHSHSLSPPPQRERGRKYDAKGSRVELRMGRLRKNYRDGQNRLGVGR